MSKPIILKMKPVAPAWVLPQDQWVPIPVILPRPGQKLIHVEVKGES